MLKPGAKLPPVRELAYQLGITPGTVARAYQLATEEGLLEATVGKGTFVRGPKRALEEIPANFVASAPESGGINFRNGHTPDLGQSAMIAELTKKILTDTPIDFAQYVRDSAIKPCRDLATEWLRAQGVDTQPSDVVLTHGAHNAVVIAMSAILHGRDPVVATSNLVYPGFRQSARISRARLIGVESDNEGLIPEALEQACHRDRPQALLISSNVHNPTCVHTPVARREAIAELARRFDFHIIEDDVYGVLTVERGPGFDQFCPERTWHATALSKCFAAGLRVGFLACPPGMGQTGLRIMQGISLSISMLLTRLVEILFREGIAEDYAHRIRAENTARLEVARSMLSDWDMNSRLGVNYVWMRKPAAWSAPAFSAACAAHDIQVATGDGFVLPDVAPPNAVRLTLSGAPNLDVLQHGLSTINSILHNPPRRLLT